MHKRGVAVLLSAVITANTLPMGAIVSYADEIKQETTQEISSQDVRSSYVQKRTLTANVKVNDNKLGTVEGVGEGNKVVLNSTFNAQDKYETITIGPFSTTQYLITSGTLIEKDADKVITIKPKSGYKWKYNPNVLLANVSVDEGTTLKYEYEEEKNIRIKGLEGTTWNKNIALNLFGDLDITFEKKADAQSITLENNENGKVYPQLDNLYFKDNTALIDEDSKHTFILEPKEGYKVGSVTLDGKPVAVEKKKVTLDETQVEVEVDTVTVGAGTLKVEFVEDIPVVETQDFNINLSGNGSVIINNQSITENSTVKLEKGKKHKFTVKASEGQFVESVKLGEIELTAQNGVYTIPSDTDTFDISITFADKMDTRIIVIGDLKVPYNGQEHKLQYTVVGPDGETVVEPTAVTFTRTNLWGQEKQYNPKEVGIHNFNIEFEGNEKYNKTNETGTFEITKFKPSINVGNVKVPYTGEQIKVPVEVTYDADYINIYTGVNLNLGAEVNIDLNLGNSDTGKIISGIFNKLGSPTVGELKKALKESEVILNGLGIKTDDIIKALDYIPEDFKINFGAPSKAGAYLSTVIVVDENAETAVGVGSLLIHRQQKNVIFSEDSLNDKEVITLDEVDNYKHEAYYEGTDTKAKIVYSGITAKGESYFSEHKPTTEGVYVATAYSYDDPQYTVGLAMRSFTIVKEFKNVEFTSDSLEDKAVIKVGTNYKHEATIEGTEKYAVIKYTGITLSGKKYSSTEKPQEAGTYMAIAYSPEDDKYVTGLGIRTFSIIREQKEVVFTEDSLPDKALVKVGTTYNGHKAVYKDTDKEAKIMYSGVTVSGETYFSAKQPTEEGIYIATAYSYDDSQYTVGLAMRTFAISKLTTKIDLTNKTTTYNGEAFKPEVVVTNRFGETIENPTVKYVYYNGKAKLASAPTKAGNYKVIATYIGDKQHLPTILSEEFTIEKANLVIDIKDAVKGKGFNDPEFTYEVKGLVKNDDIKFELTREEGEEVGKYEIDMVNQELENYNYTVKKGTLTINPLVSILNSIPRIVAEDVIIKVGDDFEPKLYAKANDKEDGDITDRIEVVKDTVDTTKAGVYEVVYKVSDKNGASATKTIKVTVNPLVSILNSIPTIEAEDVTIKVGDKFDAKSYAKANDKEDGDITDRIEVVKDTVDTTKAGVYEVVYRVSDKNGASATKTIKITVEKNTSTGGPSVSLPQVINPIEFTDIKGHWADYDIKSFVNKGYINGYEDKTFRPDKPMTRAEFVKIVNKVYNFTVKGEENFKDVSKNQWFYDDISIALKAGYINGKSKDRFAPNDKITREEAMMILTNIAKNKDANIDKLKQFKDGKSVSDWAKSSVEGAIEAGYLKGYGDNTIRSKSHMTRAEAIIVLNRIK